MTDDHGRRLSRRAALHLWTAQLGPLLLVTACGRASASSLAGSANGPTAQTGQNQSGATGCVLTPKQSEGPYFVDERLERSDIRPDPTDGSVADGVPLRLVLQVSQVTGSACSPLVGAFVDLWQCDALGNYSDERDLGGQFDTRGKKFLRGYQVTDANGTVEFLTVYPGWYPGRAVHIHFKVRTELDAKTGYELSSQVYFDDAISDLVHAQAPYSKKGQRTQKNAGDGLYRNGGSQLLVPVEPEGQGYAGRLSIGLQMA